MSTGRDQVIDISGRMVAGINKRDVHLDWPLNSMAVQQKGIRFRISEANFLISGQSIGGASRSAERK